MRIGSVVIDCSDFNALSAFWQEALGYVPREPAEDGWASSGTPAGPR